MGSQIEWSRFAYNTQPGHSIPGAESSTSFTLLYLRTTQSFIPNLIANARCRMISSQNRLIISLYVGTEQKFPIIWKSRETTTHRQFRARAISIWRSRDARGLITWCCWHSDVPFINLHEWVLCGYLGGLWKYQRLIRKRYKVKVQSYSTLNGFKDLIFLYIWGTKLPGFFLH